MSPLIRQWLILKTLCSRGRGITIRSLAQEMEVSEKTIRRDIATFVEAGVPVEESTGDNGVKSWRLDPAAARADISFTFDEALALYLGRRYLAPFAGTDLWTAAQRAYRKVRASLGESDLNYLERFANVFQDTQFGVTNYAEKAEVIDSLLIGIEDRRVVFITYRSERSTEPVTYDIHPYRFTRHRNSLYLQGFKPEDEGLRTWKVDRIESAEVDQVRFVIPGDMDLDDRLAGSMGVFHSTGAETQIVVKFTRTVARYVAESTWHPSQQLIETSDGIQVTFQLTDLHELKTWILSFGRHAEVVKPESLRLELREEAAAMGSIYGVEDSREKN